MLDLPLHPILVHFPIALSFVTPFIFLVILVGEKKSFWPPKAFIIPLLLQLMIVGSGYLAMEFGEKDEEKVERIVNEKYIEDHEESAEAFIYIQGGVLALMILSLVMQKYGFLKPLALAASLLGVIPTIQTGHSGGKLVYQYGAASAHVKNNIQGTEMNAEQTIPNDNGEKNIHQDHE